MNKLYRVVYCSRVSIPANPEAAADDIHQILNAARRRNADVGVTGGLLFSDGCFAQVLEGPITDVTDTFERIQCDSRHRDVTVLQAEYATSRDFPSWSMGFAGKDASQNALAGLGLPDLVTNHGQGGQDILALLRAVIIREDDRLAA